MKMWLIMSCSDCNKYLARHLVRLADKMQLFDLVRTSLATVTRMLSEVERNWSHSSPAIASQSGTVGRPRFEIPREQLQYLVDYEITIPDISRRITLQFQGGKTPCNIKEFLGILNKE